MAGTLSPASVLALDPSLRLRKLDGNETVPDQRDSGFPIAKDGSFLIQGLPEGEMEVLLSFPFCRDVPCLESVRLKEGQTSRMVLEAPSCAPGRIEGLVRVDGAVPFAAEVRLDALSGQDRTIEIDGEGRFLLENVQPGEYRLVLRTGGGRWTFVDKEIIRVEPDAKVERAFRFEHRKLRIHILQADGVTPVRNERFEVWMPLRELKAATDENGWFTVDPAPGCPFSLRRREDPQARVDELETPAGGAEVTLEVRLPAERRDGR